MEETSIEELNNQYKKKKKLSSLFYFISIVISYIVFGLMFTQLLDGESDILRKNAYELAFTYSEKYENVFLVVVIIGLGVYSLLSLISVIYNSCKKNLDGSYNIQQSSIQLSKIYNRTISILSLLFGAYCLSIFLAYRTLLLNDNKGISLTCIVLGISSLLSILFYVLGDYIYSNSLINFYNNVKKDNKLALNIEKEEKPKVIANLNSKIQFEKDIKGSAFKENEEKYDDKHVKVDEAKEAKAHLKEEKLKAKEEAHAKHLLEKKEHAEKLGKVEHKEEKVEEKEHSADPQISNIEKEIAAKEEAMRKELEKLQKEKEELAGLKKELDEKERQEKIKKEQEEKEQIEALKQELKEKEEVLAKEEQEDAQPKEESSQNSNDQETIPENTLEFDTIGDEVVPIEQRIKKATMIINDEEEKVLAKERLKRYFAQKYSSLVGTMVEKVPPKEGLPQGDIYFYINNKKGIPFAYVYNTTSCSLVVANLPTAYYKVLKERGCNATRCDHPKTKKPWISLVVDSNVEMKTVLECFDIAIKRIIKKLDDSKQK